VKQWWLTICSGMGVDRKVGKCVYVCVRGEGVRGQTSGVRSGRESGGARFQYCRAKKIIIWLQTHLSISWFNKTVWRFPCYKFCFLSKFLQVIIDPKIHWLSVPIDEGWMLQKRPEQRWTFEFCAPHFVSTCKLLLTLDCINIFYFINAHK
jgi:hypothetical protein